MTIKSSLLLALGACAALGLSGCGGSGGGNDVATPAAVADTVPASANDSAQSFTEYAKNQKPTDVVEPLKLQQQLPPVSDTTEPFLIGS